MTEETFSDENIEYHLVTILEKLDEMRKDKNNDLNAGKKLSMNTEIRSLEFWKSTISECLASFIYVFLVCGAVAGPSSNILMAYPLTCGFSMTFLTQFFGHVSGAHVNPAVSLAMGAIKRISVLRTGTFILVQCGGGIAGAAFLYGLTIPQHQENPALSLFRPWERFGLEFILTYLVVFSYFMSMDTCRKWTGTGAITIGMTYAACSFVFLPFLNPARSLGPSFVSNRWDSHWVDWLGPMVGGLVAGVCYEYIFNPKRSKKMKKSDEEDHSSIPSEDELNYDDLDKPQPPKFHGSTYNTYRSTTGIEATRSNYCPSLYSAPPTRLERVESLYGGTKSLYCKSPPLTRANLNRSQSVYTKSNTAINKDIIPKPGPLVPAQSLYSMRINQHNHLQNQNVQNQMVQRTETIAYGVRGVTPGTSARPENYATTERQPSRPDNYSTTERIRRDNYAATSESAYGSRNTPPSSSESSEIPIAPAVKSNRRPESTYGLLSAQQRNYQQQKASTGAYPAPGPPEGRSVIGAVATHRPPPPAHSNSSNAASYHHQHSPNPQY